MLTRNNDDFSRIKYSGDFNTFLHELRSIALTTLKTPKRLLSAGCSGLWYFEWIDKYMGKPESHIGIEYYLPRPDNLPSNVTWLQQNVYDMAAVNKESVDMVFSGQNVEHLWANELSGFLWEANRVLEQNGLLVVDSPNFPICQAYGWSHPEHFTELSIPQITKLLGISGFKIEQCFGLWGCSWGGKLLPLDPGQENSSLFSHTLMRILARLKIFNSFAIRKRISFGLKNPEAAFVWWIVGKKISAPRINAHQLLTAVQSEFDANWPSRIQRQSVVTSLKYNPKTDLVLIPKGFKGAAIFGPYLPLRPGKYILGYYLTMSNQQSSDISEEEIAVVDCAIGMDGKVIVSRTITLQDLLSTPVSLVTVEINLSELTFGVQVRLITYGKVGFFAYRTIFLREGFKEEMGE